jgi:hypothetical protein
MGGASRILDRAGVPGLPLSEIWGGRTGRIPEPPAPHTRDRHHKCTATQPCHVSFTLGEIWEFAVKRCVAEELRTFVMVFGIWINGDGILGVEIIGFNGIL